MRHAQSFEVVAKLKGLLELRKRPFLFILTCNFAGFISKNMITYKKVNKGHMGNRELSRLSQIAFGSNGGIRKSLCNRLS